MQPFVSNVIRQDKTVPDEMKSDETNYYYDTT